MCIHISLAHTNIKQGASLVPQKWSWQSLRPVPRFHWHSIRFRTAQTITCYCITTAVCLCNSTNGVPVLGIAGNACLPVSARLFATYTVCTLKSDDLSSTHELTGPFFVSSIDRLSFSIFTTPTDRLLIFDPEYALNSGAHTFSFLNRCCCDSFAAHRAFDNERRLCNRSRQSEYAVRL